MMPVLLPAAWLVAAAGTVWSSPAPDSAAARMLALGDSYTIGESVSADQRWPVQLVDLLRGQGLAIEEPQIVARTGWTTDELAAGMANAVLVPPYDLVTLLIGVNNQYRGWRIDTYQDEFAALLARAVDLAGGDPLKVLVLSIPDWGITPFAEGRDRSLIAEEIDRFNEVNRAETDRAGARYVDVTPVSRRATQEPALLASDGLHPSGVMYGRWAELALPVALEALATGVR